ncbi:unnamed protein product [Sympodiomycopsis kandeliae]
MFPTSPAMVVRLRLARHGTKNNPFYHIVAIADHKPRDARPIEKLGEYDPIPRPKIFKTPQLNPDEPILSSGIPSEEELTKLEKRLEWNSERITWWLNKGAQPSKPLAKMLDKANLIPPGQFYKGMYRPPTQEGLQELIDRSKKSSTEIRSEMRKANRETKQAGSHITSSPTSSSSSKQQQQKRASTTV